MHFVLVIILAPYVGIYKHVILPVLADSVQETRSCFQNERERFRKSTNNFNTLEKVVSTFCGRSVVLNVTTSENARVVKRNGAFTPDKILATVLKQQFRLSPSMELIAFYNVTQGPETGLLT